MSALYAYTVDGVLNTLSILPQSTTVKVCHTECDADRGAGRCVASEHLLMLPSCYHGRHANLVYCLSTRQHITRRHVTRGHITRQQIPRQQNDPLLADYMEYVVDISSVSHAGPERV